MIVRSDSMRFGITSPIVQSIPGVSNLQGSARGDVDDLRRLFTEVERLGYDHATFPEHVAVPADAAARIGGTWWAQLPTLGFAAACTTRLRLVSYVVVLGYHHPVEIVKSYGTVDRLCNGRLVLGVGVGTLRPEFELLGADFESRGRKADESLDLIRRLWGRPDALDGWVVDPCGTSTSVPIWVGGQSRASFDRAVRVGNGWMPFALPLEQIAEWVRAAELPDDFEVAFGPMPPLDPIGDPSSVEREIEEHERAGGTALQLRFAHQSLAQYFEQLEAFASIVALQPAG